MVLKLLCLLGLPQWVLGTALHNVVFKKAPLVILIGSIPQNSHLKKIQTLPAPGHVMLVVLTNLLFKFFTYQYG